MTRSLNGGKAMAWETFVNNLREAKDKLALWKKKLDNCSLLAAQVDANKISDYRNALESLPKWTGQTRHLGRYIEDLETWLMEPLATKARSLWLEILAWGEKEIERNRVDSGVLCGILPELEKIYTNLITIQEPTSRKLAARACVAIIFDDANRALNISDIYKQYWVDLSGWWQKTKTYSGSGYAGEVRRLLFEAFCEMQVVRQAKPIPWENMLRDALEAVKNASSLLADFPWAGKILNESKLLHSLQELLKKDSANDPQSLLETLKTIVESVSEANLLWQDLQWLDEVSGNLDTLDHELGSHFFRALQRKKGLENASGLTEALDQLRSLAGEVSDLVTKIRKALEQDARMFQRVAKAIPDMDERERAVVEAHELLKKVTDAISQLSSTTFTPTREPFKKVTEIGIAKDHRRRTKYLIELWAQVKRKYEELNLKAQSGIGGDALELFLNPDMCKDFGQGQGWDLERFIKALKILLERGLVRISISS
jgi:hypothetical protein